jgi:hypothetical protein
MATKKATARKAAARTRKAAGRERGASPGDRPEGELPRLVYAQASPRSIGGASLFDAGQVSADDVVNYMSEQSAIHAAVDQLTRAGFQVLQVAATTVNIAGTPAQYEAAFGVPLHTVEREVIKPGARVDTATFVDTPDDMPRGFVDTSNSDLAGVLEGVAIEEPVYEMAENAFAPNMSYWYLDVPGDVSLGLNADAVHRGGTTGAGINVVMVDSGWYEHPYFRRRGYKYSPVVLGPGAADPTVDANGHGTAESANVFAAAPDVNFTMVKYLNTNATAAFNAAVALRPHIISCSWGSSLCGQATLPPSLLPQATAISAAVAAGIVVVFSAGNGHNGFPGQHPEVISAGGAFMHPDGTLEASDYASGFASTIYTGRNCPDVSGLVGMQPSAASIMLPIAAGCAIDTGRAGGMHATGGDETAPDDGWSTLSGTSAAAPQIAGVCALIKQACPRLTPAEVRSILMNTATDVTAGSANDVCGVSNAATVGPDLATGHGLVNAHKAVLAAKLRCATVVGPTIDGPIIGPRITPRVPPVPPTRDIIPRPEPGPVSPEPIVGPRRGPGPGPGPEVGPGPGPQAAEASAAMAAAEAAAAAQAGQGQALTPEDVAALEKMLGESGELGF